MGQPKRRQGIRTEVGAGIAGAVEVVVDGVVEVGGIEDVGGRVAVVGKAAGGEA